MRLSGFSVVAFLLFPFIVFAQHASGGGGGSSSSSGGGSSSGGSSSGGSHGGGGYSSGGGGGSSSGSSGGGHSSGGSTSHSSGGGGSSSGGSSSHYSSGSNSRSSVTSLPHGGSSGSSSHSIDDFSRPSGRPEFSSKAPAVTLDKETGGQVESMIKSGKSLEEIRQFVHTRTGVDPDTRPIRIETNEKRSFISALRHPFQKPQTAVVADLRHRICPNNSCRVCPAGSSANGKGGCSGPSTNLCASGSYWSRGGCQVLGQSWRYNYCRYDSLSGPSNLTLLQQRMQRALAERDVACSADPAGQECSEKNAKYQRALADYNRQSHAQRTGFQQCLNGSSFGFFDPMF